MSKAGLDWFKVSPWTNKTAALFISKFDQRNGASFFLVEVSKTGLTVASYPQESRISFSGRCCQADTVV